MPSARSAQATRLSVSPTPARWYSRAPMIRFPVKLVAIVYASPPQAIFCREDAGLKPPKDLEESSIANPAGGSIPDLFPAFAKAAGIDAEQGQLGDREQRLASDPARRGKVTLRRPVYRRRTLLRAQAAPAKLVRFAYSDPGLSYYGNGIVARTPRS